MNLVRKAGRIAVLAAFLGTVSGTSVAHADTTINSQADAYAFAAGVASPLLAGCVMSGPAMIVCGGIAAGAVLCYMYCEDILNWMMAEHTRNKRASTKQRHQEGQARQKRDQKRKEERRKKGKGGPGSN